MRESVAHHSLERLGYSVKPKCRCRVNVFAHNFLSVLLFYPVRLGIEMPLVGPQPSV